MPPKKFSLKTTQHHQKQRLDQVLADWLPQVLNQPVSKGKVRKLIIAGAVYLNGTRVRIASKELLANAKIDVYIDLQRLNSTGKDKDIPFLMTESRILFEDDYLIVVNKPPGLPTQPTLDEARDNLFAAVKKFLAQRQNCPVPQIYLGLHHRLDRDTSGIVLFTKATQANPGIAEIFSTHLAEKTYQALGYRGQNSEFSSAWSVKNHLGRSKSSGKKAKFCSVRSGGDFAHTDFKVLEKTPSVLWLEATLHTGRTHQIRVHLSESGIPILGDILYHGPTEVGGMKVQRVMLHAVNLTFPHPIYKNKISIQCSLPEDFRGCLKAFQKGGLEF